MFIGVLTFTALAILPVVLAGGYLNGLLQALNATGLDELANATASLNLTTLGQLVLTQLSEGNKTIFAPTDSAWSGINPALISDEASLADIISYHIVSGNYINQTQTYPNVTIGRTLLNDSALVTLEGNQSQVLIWSKFDNGSFFVINQGSNITVLNTTSYNDTAVLAIDSVLIPPPNISTVLNNASYDLTAAAALVNSTTLPSGSSVLDVLSSAHGVTVFAPNNAGVQAAQSSLASVSSNATALLDVLDNHVINGTSIYSTEMTNGTTFISAAGQKIAFLVNSTGLFVSVGGSNQVQIVRPDVLTSNGVIHVVDGVMLDTSANAAAASSAFASATSVAATQSGAVTSSPSPHSGAVRNVADNWKLGMLAGMVVGFRQFV